jgi:alkylation response protein AidB-like acyl-CoA dehydrogenase
MLARAGRAIDGILNDPSDEAVSEVAVRVAEAKVLSTEIAILATNKRHELGGTRSTLGEFGFDPHWRNARAHTLHDPARWKYFQVGNHLLNGIGPPRRAWR